MRVLLGLCGVATLLLAPTIAQGNPPVVIDASNSFQTTINAYRVAREGFPWGWVPNVSIIVKMDPIESDDVLVLQHFRGKRKWGAVQKCRLRQHWKAVGLAQFACRGDEKMAVNATGKFSVSVSYKQGAADKLHKKIETLHYKVIKYKCDNRHVKRRWKPSSCFVVDHDFRIGEAWMTELNTDATAPSYILLRTWFKYGDKGPYRPKARCYLAGKKVAEAKVERKQTEVTYRSIRRPNDSGTRKTWARWYWRFYDFATQPPTKTISTVSYPKVFYVSKNPGSYTCVITADGDKIATISFEVGADGKVVRPPCQGDTAAATVRTLDNVHLLKVAYTKKANIKHKARDFAASPLYGRRWTKGCPPR